MLPVCGCETKNFSFMCYGYGDCVWFRGAAGGPGDGGGVSERELSTDVFLFL